MLKRQIIFLTEEHALRLDMEMMISDMDKSEILRMALEKHFAWIELEREKEGWKVNFLENGEGYEVVFPED